jgi:hypothetical protein
MPPVRSHNTIPQHTSPRHNESSSRQSNSPEAQESNSSDIESQANSMKKTFCWKYFSKFDNRWKCNLCKSQSMAKTFCRSSSTTHPTKHLRKMHYNQLTPEECQELPNQQNTDPRQFFIDPKILHRLIIEFILDHRLPFRIPTSKSFKNIIQYLNSTIIDKLPSSSNTYRDDAIKFHTAKKAIIIDHLQKAKSQIHISFDL